MDTKELIIDAASEVFAKYGYYKASMDKIAQASNLTKGALYYFYKNKADLFYAVVESGIHSLNRKLDEQIKNENVYKVIEQYIHICLTHPELAAIILSENLYGLDAALQQRLLLLRSGITKRLDAIIREGEKSSFLRPLNHEIVTAAFLGILGEIVRESMSGELTCGQEEIAQTVYAMLKGYVLA